MSGAASGCGCTTCRPFRCSNTISCPQRESWARREIVPSPFLLLFLGFLFSNVISLTTMACFTWNIFKFYYLSDLLCEFRNCKEIVRIVIIPSAGWKWSNTNLSQPMWHQVKNPQQKKIKLLSALERMNGKDEMMNGKDERMTGKVFNEINTREWMALNATLGIYKLWTCLI